MPGDFEPTTGDLGSSSPNSFGGAGASGGILGTNPLQGVVEKFAGAVTNLDTAIGKLPQTGMGGESQAGQFKLFPGVQNQFESHSPSFFGSSSGAEFGTPSYFGSGSNGGQFGTPSYFGSGSQSPPADEQQPGQSGPPPSGGSSGSSSGGDKKAPTVGGLLGSAATTTGSLGLSALSGQNALNTYAFQSALMGSNMSQQQLMTQAVGTFANSNGGTNLNFTGTSTQDIAQETAIQQQIAGSADIMGTQSGRAGVGATNAASLANPTLSGTQAAQSAQQMYMPQTSLRMRMMGAPVTPRIAGQPGGANSMAAVDQGQMKFLFPQFNGDMSSKHLASALQPGGMAYSDLQAEGLNPATVVPQMEVSNALERGGTSGQGQAPLGTQQQQQLINQYQRGSLAQRNQAGETLQKYGIPQSNLAALKTKAGAAAGAAGDLEPSYAKGLQDSIKALNTFKGDLMHILDTLGLNGPLGSLLGAGSQLGGIGASAFGAFKLGKGVFNLGKKILGKGSKDAEEGAKDAGKGAEDAGDDAGGSGIEGGPEAVLGAVTGWGLDKAMSRLPGKYGKWMGQTFTPHNLLKDLEGPFGGGDGPNKEGGGIGSNAAGMVGQKQSRNLTLANPNATAKKAVALAEQQIGTPYAYGEEKPGQGFDCAGLTQYAYEGAGIAMPRTSKAQYDYWKSKDRLVNIKDAIEGDLLFSKDSTNNPNGHVAVMVTGSKIISADQTGTPVRIRPFNSSEWEYAARPSGTISGFSQIGKTTGNTRTAGTSSNSSLLFGANVPGAGGADTGPGSIGGGLGDSGITGSSEMSAFTQASTGSTSAGSDYYGGSTMQAAAMGGDAPAGVTAWVGERGPELVHFQQSGTVLTAAQSQQLAKGVMSKPSGGNNSSNNLLCSTLNPAYGGGGGSGNVSLTFSNGSISFNQNVSAGQSTPPGDFKDGAPTTGMSIRSQYHQTRRAMQKMDMYESIANGES